MLLYYFFLKLLRSVFVQRHPLKHHPLLSGFIHVIRLLRTIREKKKEINELSNGIQEIYISLSLFRDVSNLLRSAYPECDTTVHIYSAIETDIIQCVLWYSWHLQTPAVGLLIKDYETRATYN